MTAQAERGGADDSGAELSEREYRTWLAHLAPQPDTLATCCVLAADAGLIWMALHLAASASWTRWFAPALFAQALVHAYLVQHECVHGSATSGRWNTRLGRLLGMLLLQPFHARQHSHSGHHKAPGHRERDPSNARTVASFRGMAPWRLRLLDWMWRAWLPVFVANERVGLVRSSFVHHPERPDARSDRRCMFIALWIHVLAGVYCAAYPALHFTLFAYVVGFVLLLVVEEMANIPHHLESPLQQESLPPWRQMQATHSCRPVPMWSRLVLLNFGAHTAHHVFSTLPWRRLPEVERELARRGAVRFVAHEFAASRTLRRRPFADVFAGYLAARDD